MSDYTTILMFGQEVFGIPIVPIILLVIWAIASAQEKRDKARKAAEELWEGISLGMSKKQVVDKLGSPQEIVPGIPQKWVYEFEGLRGYLMFENDVLMRFQAPQ
jgi:hypothetical protein